MIVIAVVERVYEADNPDCSVIVQNGAFVYAVANVIVHPVEVLPSVISPAPSVLFVAIAGEVPQDVRVGIVPVKFICPATVNFVVGPVVPMPTLPFVIAHSHFVSAPAIAKNSLTLRNEIQRCNDLVVPCACIIVR